MLFVGDALQLPPIEPTNAKDKDDDDNERAKGRTKKGEDFFFRAEEWQDSTWVQRVVLLTRNLRQAEDPEYAETLERMAKNALNSGDEPRFRNAVLKGGLEEALDPDALPGVLRVFHRRTQCRWFAESA